MVRADISQRSIGGRRNRTEGGRAAAAAPAAPHRAATKAAARPAGPHRAGDELGLLENRNMGVDFTASTARCRIRVQTRSDCLGRACISPMDGGMVRSTHARPFATRRISLGIGNPGRPTTIRGGSDAAARWLPKSVSGFATVEPDFHRTESNTEDPACKRAHNRSASGPMGGDRSRWAEAVVCVRLSAMSHTVGAPNRRCQPGAAKLRFAQPDDRSALRRR